MCRCGYDDGGSAVAAVATVMVVVAAMSLVAVGRVQGGVGSWGSA